MTLRPGKLTAARRLCVARPHWPGAEREAAGRGNALAESAAPGVRDGRMPRGARGRTGGRVPAAPNPPLRLARPQAAAAPRAPDGRVASDVRALPSGLPRLPGAPEASAVPLLSLSPALSQFHFFEKQTCAFPFPCPK